MKARCLGPGASFPSPSLQLCDAPQQGRHIACPSLLGRVPALPPAVCQLGRVRFIHGCFTFNRTKPVHKSHYLLRDRELQYKYTCAQACTHTRTHMIIGMLEAVHGKGGNEIHLLERTLSHRPTIPIIQETKPRVGSLWSPGGGFPGRLVVKNPPANAGDIRDVGSVPGLGSSPGAGNGSSLQCSCLGNPMDRGAWWATVRGAAKSRTQLKRHHKHTRTVCRCITGLI